MNVLKNLLIENKEVLFKTENSVLSFHELGNGDIYISAYSKNNDYSFYIDEKTHFNIVNSFRETLKLIENMKTNEKYISNNKFVWASDEWNQNNEFTSLIVENDDNGIFLSFNNNVNNNDDWVVVSFNTNRGHNRSISISFAHLLWNILENHESVKILKKLKLQNNKNNIEIIEKK